MKRNHYRGLRPRPGGSWMLRVCREEEPMKETEKMFQRGERKIKS
jgi:hypothetical protein